MPLEDVASTALKGLRDRREGVAGRAARSNHARFSSLLAISDFAEKCVRPVRCRRIEAATLAEELRELAVVQEAVLHLLKLHRCNFWSDACYGISDFLKSAFSTR